MLKVTFIQMNENTINLILNILLYYSEDVLAARAPSLCSQQNEITQDQVQVLPYSHIPTGSSTHHPPNRRGNIRIIPTLIVFHLHSWEGL